ncbi:MAG TPA: sulfatase [Verrucomicrobiales bacterium]|nr:sulfatase [Verrucomicrobiales bacterium]
MNLELTRRQLFGRASAGIGGAALASLLGEGRSFAAPHFAPKAKRVIYLFMHGGPSQLDLFDHKPGLKKLHGQEFPASVLGDQRLTGMTSGQKSKPVTASLFDFKQHGQSGAWMSELLPHMGRVADDLCLIRSMNTEAINHDPGVTLLQTGHQQPGRPSFGAWASYGLGSENASLPAFVVLISRGSAARPADPLYARLWGSGFLPSNHQGVSFRSSGDPVLYLSNPPGIDSQSRREQLDAIQALNRRQFTQRLDPEIETRIAQYEMAYRMQSSVPDLISLRDESKATLDAYGPQSRVPGSFAANCLLARRMAESGVRFIQLYHRGWDQHYNLPSDLRLQCGDIDQPCAALISDLMQRGLLDDTLIVWGGEFGRTTYSQGKLEPANHGRDHHGRCFTMWLAGGGVKPGLQFGETDDFCFNIARDPVHVHDLNATLLHLLGIDHEHLTFRAEGRDYRLTDVHGRVMKALLV